MSHSPLSPSSSGIWLKCDGYLRFQRFRPDLDIEQPWKLKYSDAGSKAHEILSNLLLGKMMPRKDRFPELDLDAINIAYKYISNVINGGSFCVESKLAYDIKAHPMLYGTADVIAINNSVLHVIDFKYGKTLVVAKQNTQLMTYAVYARKYFRETSPFIEEKFASCMLHIVQPRYSRSKPASVYLVSEKELDDIEGEILKKEELYLDKNIEVTYNRGQHCKYCPFVDTCEFLRHVNNDVKNSRS